MRVLHVPFGYFPDSPGGTEVYVKSLVVELSRLGIDGVVAAPAGEDLNYVFDNVSVHRFAVGKGNPFGAAHGAADPVAAAGFARIITDIRPDIVHLHAFTSAVSVLLVDAAKTIGAKVVFTYHTPTVTCVRGTLMRQGITPCDGVMDLRRCAACNLQKHGMPSLIAAALARIPISFGETLIGLGAGGGLLTALQMTALVEKRFQASRGLLTSADHIVAVCDWVYRSLLANGIEEDRLTLCRQGLPFPHKQSGRQAASRDKVKELRIAYMGRFDHGKGIDIVIDALRRLSSNTIYFDIYGVRQSSNASAYESALRRAAERDRRVTIKAPVAPENAVETLTDYDLVAVPSRWLETGPLVVLEAFAAGVPVIGSRLGGIAELIRDGIDGILLPVADVDVWEATLRELAENPNRLRDLGRGIKAPRSMAAAAQEMDTLYKKLTDLTAAKKQSGHA